MNMDWMDGLLIKAADTIQRRDQKPIQDAIAALGGWPVLESMKEVNDSSDLDWKKLLGKMKNLGFNYNIFFHLSHVYNPSNNTENILMVSTDIICKFNSHFFRLTFSPIYTC